MADLYTARTAIDFQQDLFHELGFGTGHPDEDELWGKISFFGPFHFSLHSSFLFLSFFLSSLLWNQYCRPYWLSSVGGIVWEQIKHLLCDPPPQPPRLELRAPRVLSVKCWRVCGVYALCSCFGVLCMRVSVYAWVYVGYIVKWFRMDLSVTWPLGICR